MSRTHKTKPLGVKMCQGHVGFKEDHDHRKGPCDLPKMTPDNAAWWGRQRTRCHWQADFNDPMSYCGCYLCTGHFERKSNGKRNRKEARRKTRNWKKDPDLYNEELIEQKRELW